MIYLTLIIIIGALEFKYSFHKVNYIKVQGLIAIYPYTC
jgi:hypothetical protein